MSFSLINKFFFLIVFLIFISSCSTKSVYEKIKLKKYEKPLIQNFDNEKIIINFNINKNINFENPLRLKDFKNDNQYFNNVIIEGNIIYAIQKNKLYSFNYNTGELISDKELN